MRTFIYCTILLTFTFLHTVSFAQTCSRAIPAFMAAPGGYSISGTGLLVSENDVTTLSFDNAFGTQSGPDLHVYLALHFESPVAPGNTNVDLGELISNSGAQSYAVPTEVSLSDYNYVLIHCKSFNHWWGGGLLEEINCVSATDVLSEELSPIIYPNPAVRYVAVKAQLPSLEVIMVLDAMGKIRITKSVSTFEQSQLDVSPLESGLFFIIGRDQNGKLLFSRSISKL